MPGDSDSKPEKAPSFSLLSSGCSSWGLPAVMSGFDCQQRHVGVHLASALSGSPSRFPTTACSLSQLWTSLLGTEHNRSINPRRHLTAIVGGAPSKNPLSSQIPDLHNHELNKMVVCLSPFSFGDELLCALAPEFCLYPHFKHLTKCVW